ncbi:hypothetical protein S83_033167 [Arachis hypogaea]
MLKRREWSEIEKLSCCTVDRFVDTSIFMAIKAIQHVMESNIKNESNSPSSILHEERVGDLSVVVKCDIRNGNRV